MPPGLSQPLWPESRFNLTTPLSLWLTALCVASGVVLYARGLPYEGSALVYLGGGVCLSYPYYSARYTAYMTWLVMLCLLPMTLWLQNKGVETGAWHYRPHDTYWLWITQGGEGWGRWTRHLWLGNDMPAMEYLFYPLFCLFQMTVYSLYSHLLPDAWFEQSHPGLKWVFPAGFSLLLAGFLSLDVLYARPGKTDYPYWMTSCGYLITGAAYCLSPRYRDYTRSPAFWIWVVGMGVVFLTAWEFFHSCWNHDWVYDPANSMPFAYSYRGAGIPVTQLFGYLTTATTFQALLMLLIRRFGHIVVKNPLLVPFGPDQSRFAGISGRPMENPVASTSPKDRRRLVILLLALVAPLPLCAQDTTNASPSTDLTQLNLDQLLQVKVTSVSKHPESLAGADAAIYVVSQEDIQRQGFRTIADSLRTVPGMEVAQINAHSWAISPRGFNGEYAPKLLALMDGRSVYTPLFAGVYWDVQDTMLEDLDRIEVIRGPGAALWGANAVNGVLNILSKSARETQGTLVTGGGGSEERGFGAVRYGGQLGDDACFRVYAKYDNHDASAFPNGDDAQDDWWMARGGFRADWEAANDNLLTLQGDVYRGREHWSYALPTPEPPYTRPTFDNEIVAGGNLLGRWTHTFANDSEFKFQTYYDRTERESNLPRENRDTFDAELQHRLAPLHRNSVTWGLDYRLTADAIRNNYANAFHPDHRTLQLFGTFLQDEIQLVEERLRLTLGSKFEHNDFTGFEFQPNARLAWTPTDRQTVWGAVSRAVRTPARAEADIRINQNAPSPPFPPGSVITILGDPRGRAEELLAYELGYRVRPHARLSFDLATFYNVYDEQRSLEAGPPASAPPLPLATYYVRNRLAGETYGAELAADWQVLEGWLLRGSYTYFHMNLKTDDGGSDVNTIRLLEGDAPRHECSLRSVLDLPRHVQFDTGLRYVDSLTAPGAHVPSYLTMDVHVAWRPSPSLEFAVAGLNLAQARHLEFAPTILQTPQREIERSVYGKMTWRF